MQNIPQNKTQPKPGVLVGKTLGEMFANKDRNINRVDLEGELVGVWEGGYPTLRLDDANLAELLAYNTKTTRQDSRRAFGRVKITIERLSE